MDYESTALTAELRAPKRRVSRLVYTNDATIIASGNDEAGGNAILYGLKRMGFQPMRTLGPTRGTAAELSSV
jgi:hypothetical protein